MQVEIETKPKVYEPKTLKITFETKSEYLMFADMMAYDISIPGLVYHDQTTKQGKLMQMMNKIQEAIEHEL